MRFEPVQFIPPEPDRVVLENGLVVYLLEDHELPLVTVTATIRTGNWLDPADKIGLAGLAGITMRTGGTQPMSAAQVDEELEQLAAVVSVGIGTESGSATLDVLKKDLDRGLRIFADILMTPAFDSKRVELAKLQAIEGIRRRQDQPQSIAGREFYKLLYGPTHPFARESSVESVTRIMREDLQAFHARTVHPNGIILGVTGDFDRAAMLASLRELFGRWPRGDVPSIVLPPITADQADGENGTHGKKVVRFIGKGTTQTHLRAGHLSVKEDDPDYPALSLLNDILGGSGFRSRLFQDVRTRQGLAYSVGSSLRTGTHEQGAWLMRAETKLASTQEVVSRLVANLERLRKEPVTDSELEQAKEAFVNSFVFSFTSPSSIVNRLIGLEYDGLPKDFLQQLRDKVVKLTKEDLLAAARKHLHPDRLRILAVGPPEALPQVLSGFGEVKEIKLPPEG
jgi:predicted Zn-dependent peptidase